MTSPHHDCSGPEYEFAVGHATGVRSWWLDSEGWLRSVSYFTHVWQPGENVAECMLLSKRGPLRASLRLSNGLELSYLAGTMFHQPFGSDGVPGDAPHQPTGRCDSDIHGCGYWAYHDGSDYPMGDVTGVIEGYGRTTIGPKGFRSEKARLVAIALPRPQLQRLFWARAAAAAVGLALSLLAIIDGPWWIAAWDALWASAFGLLASHAWRQTLSAPRAREKLVRSHYPDLKIYRSVKAMTAAHRPDPRLDDAEPTS